MSTETQISVSAPSVRTGADEPRLAPWEYAGLLITYWCNAKCVFCYVYSGPDRGGRMSPDHAAAMWRGLDAHAQRNDLTMRVHLAGGEPFGDFEHLISIVRAARDAGCTPLERVETNAFWCREDDETRVRLTQLRELGMERIYISADVYHQEFVPFDRVQRCVRIGREVLGHEGVTVRWWDFTQPAIDLKHADAPTRHAAYRDAMQRHQDRLTGRAADRLASFYERFPASHFAGQNCVEEVLHSRHVHIDAYGHVSPGVCAGIILGSVNADAPPNAGIEELWNDLSANWRSHAVVGPVVAGGSFALFQAAAALGYKELEGGYANKCHLCTHVRQFLFERGGWESTIGPAECYADEHDKRDSAEAVPFVAMTAAGKPLRIIPPKRRKRPQAAMER